MRELSLFSGAGGGLLGTKHLLGWDTIGYVEIDDYCQRVIAQRIKDGLLDNAPIFTDIKAFISQGYAEAYQGMVDVITAGFPCQPFSIAGRRKGAEDDRNLWPETAETISIVGPQFVLLENVPGIRRYLPVVVRDLRRAGYEVSRPLLLGADDVGAPHRRKRVWILADASSRDNDDISKRKTIFDISRQDVADALGNPIWIESRWRNGESGAGQAELTGTSWWATEPDLGRMAHGVAHKVDRLKAIGNGQVSLVVAKAWEILTK